MTTVDSIEEAFAAVDDKRPEDNKRIILDVASPVADELLKRASVSHLSIIQVTTTTLLNCLVLCI